MPKRQAIANRRHLKFAEEYLKDCNAVGALLRTGYEVTTLKSAQAAAYRLLGRDDIKLEIARRQAEAQIVTKVNNEKVIEEVAKIAFSNITDVTSWNAQHQYLEIKDLDRIPKAHLAALSKITNTSSARTSKITVEMHDKLGALRLLGQYLGVANDLNQALATLMRYGLNVFQDGNGRWHLKDEQDKIDLYSDLQTQVESGKTPSLPEASGQAIEI